MSCDPRSTRVASVIAATAVALASGTNYAFSAWGPEFGKHLQLSATQTNFIGVAGNMGMYATGIPAGLIVDKKGPRYGVLIGTVSFAIGYFPLHSAYEVGPGSGAFSLPILALCSFLTGFGSCSSFSAAIKTATVNWPDNRGTATAFPLAGFGLSAFFFATIASLAFPNNVSDFLLMLSVGTLCLNIGALPFMTLVSTDGAVYSAVPSDDRLPEVESHAAPVKPRRARTSHHPTDEEAAGSDAVDAPPPPPPPPDAPRPSRPASISSSETSSLSRTFSDNDEDESPPARGTPATTLSRRSTGRSPDVEVTGFRILGSLEFWQLFAILALLAGVGLMTINNIGNDVKALLRRWDRHSTNESMQKQEQMHVSILSLASFTGRLLSGIGSDVLIKQLHASRFWCLVASAGLFVVAQVFGLLITNPAWVVLLSATSGLAYGALFGVFPALVADTFGTRGLSFNWGLIILAPVLSGNVFNLYYGAVYDDHSHVINDGSLDCPDGNDCFNLAYRVTLLSSLAGLALSLWTIRYQRMRGKQRGPLD